MSVAIVGASDEEGKIGSGLVQSVTQAFQGDVFYVNPKYETIYNETCYASVLEIPQQVSHVIIAIARQHVIQCVEECVQAAIKNIIVISAGIKVADAQG